MKGLRYTALDGWRAIAILLVLCAHLLPLGRHAWGLNTSFGLAGMALFFCLSGFLVTDVLLDRPNILSFLIRRLFRILPLAWLYLLIVFFLKPMSFVDGLAHTFFYANYPPKPLIPMTDHLWSLCVELHFYLGLVLLVTLFRKYWMVLVPVLCVLITLLRINNGMHYSVITHFRVDEILIGGVLAMINRGVFISPEKSTLIKAYLSRLKFEWVLILFLVSCHIDSGFMNYFRPYLSAALIGTTLFAPHGKVHAVLSSRIMLYLASISFAVYIIHPLLVHSWLGSGGIVEKYAKRPLLFVVLFLLAHGSTFYYEKRAIALGRKLSDWVSRKPSALASKS
ncbi:MAG: acyltransferase [Pseudomonadota bacterium]